MCMYVCTNVYMYSNICNYVHITDISSNTVCIYMYMYVCMYIYMYVQSSVSLTVRHCSYNYMYVLCSREPIYKYTHNNYVHVPDGDLLLIDQRTVSFWRFWKERWCTYWNNRVLLSYAFLYSLIRVRSNLKQGRGGSSVPDGHTAVDRFLGETGWKHHVLTLKHLPATDTTVTSNTLYRVIFEGCIFGEFRNCSNLRN